MIYTLGTVLTRGIGILLLPIYTRYLTPGEYGVIDLFMIVASLVNLTIALEISQAIVRYYHDASTDTEKAQYTSTAFWFTLGVYCIYFCVSIFFADTLTLYLLEDVTKTGIFILATAAIATNGIFYFAQNQLKWRIEPKASIIASLLNVGITAGIAVYLLIYQNMKIESIFIGQIFGNIMGTLIAIYYARSNYQFMFNRTKLKMMLSFSTPLVFSSVAVFIALYIDRIAIKQLLGFEELGIYGVAYRFASIASLIMVGFQSSLSPLIYKHYQEAETPQNIVKLFHGFMIFSLALVSGAILFSYEAIVVFTTEQFYSASHLIAPLVLIVLLSNMYIFAPGIGIAKKTKIIASITIFSAIVNTVLNYTLIPMIGVYGAVLATFISALIAFIAYIKLSDPYYPIPYEWMKIILVSTAVILISYATKFYFNELTIINIVVKSVFYMFVLYYLVNSLTNISILKKYFVTRSNL